MADIEIGTILSSMSADLNKRIVELDKKVDKKKAGLEEKSMLDKIFINRDINGFIREERLLSQLVQLLFNIRNSSKDKVIIPNEMKKDVESLCSLLNDKEVEQFKKLFTGCLKKIRDSKLKEVKGNISKSKSIIEQLGLGKDKFEIRDSLDKYDSMLYTSGINEVDKEFSKKDLITDINYNSRNAEDYMSFAEQKMLLNVSEMHKFGELKYDVSTTNVVENIAGIRNAFVARTRINAILKWISTVCSDLDKVEEMEVMNVKNYLTKLEVKYLRELEKVNNYLDKFDFTSVRMQVENRKSRIEFLEDLRNNMAIYEEMSYQLKKVETESPDNIQSIMILNQKMSLFVSQGILSSSQLEKALDNGIKRYKIERVLMNDNVGQQLFNDYLIYYRTTKDSTKLSLIEYVKKNHKDEDLEKVINEVNDSGTMKM